MSENIYAKRIIQEDYAVPGHTKKEAQNIFYPAAQKNLSKMQRACAAELQKFGVN